MAKPTPKRPKRPSDPVQLAKLIGDIATGQQTDSQIPTAPPTAEDIRRVMSALGKVGGPKGGAARAKALSPKKRTEIAKKAAKTRWNTKTEMGEKRQKRRKHMTREAKPIAFTLTKEEASYLMEPAGEGGQQQLADLLKGQLENGNLTILLDDAELGKLIRYMTQYGSGGFQGRLQKAFRRPITSLIAGRV